MDVKSGFLDLPKFATTRAHRNQSISTLLKIYTLPNHTITIGVCNLETQLSSLLYGRGASFGQKCHAMWMSVNL
jgi:hypothetical protein